MRAEFTIPGTVPSLPRHAVSSQSWNAAQLETLFSRAEWMSRQPRQRLGALAQHLVVGLLFYQNSTRTMISFQAASGLLGARHVGFTDVKTTRAGDFFQETLEDTIRVLGCYSDLLVLRHIDDDAADRAARLAMVPVISAGTGDLDHPTQGMLDTWMMTRALGNISALRIGLVGDPHCRALRAITTIVSKFSPTSLVVLSPARQVLPAAQQALLDRAGTNVTFVGTAAEMLRSVDIISMIPVELPDFHVATAPARAQGQLPDRFAFTRKLIERHGRDVIILHTGPRGDELPDDVDGLANVRYFDSVRSGVFLRAALISALWERWGHDIGGTSTLTDDPAATKYRAV